MSDTQKTMHAYEPDPESPSKYKPCRHCGRGPKHERHGETGGDHG